jgi:hypothetical protein
VCDDKTVTKAMGRSARPSATMCGVNCVDNAFEHDPARNLNDELGKAGKSSLRPKHIINTKRVTLANALSTPRLAMQIPCALTDNALLVPFITEGR